MIRDDTSRSLDDCRKKKREKNVESVYGEMKDASLKTKPLTGMTSSSSLTSSVAGLWY